MELHACQDCFAGCVQQCLLHDERSAVLQVASQAQEWRDVAVVMVLPLADLLRLHSIQCW